MTDPRSTVYVNWGRTVVDCPATTCCDAREAKPGQIADTCVHGHTFAIDWPDDLPQVIAVLAERTNERHRSWFPQDHPLAVATGQPHGQSIDELRAETRWLEEQSSPPAPEGRPTLEQMLAGYGLTLADDGTTLRGM